MVKDEVEYFQLPHSVKFYSCAQLLLKKAQTEVAADPRKAKVFVFKLIHAAKKSTDFCQVLLLMMLPQPVCLGPEAAENAGVISELLENELCNQLVANKEQINLFAHPSYLLVKIATLHPKSVGRAYLLYLES